MPRDKLVSALVDLDPQESIDEGLDQEGGLQFRANLEQFVGQTAHGRTPIEDAQLVAMSLTESCCKLGIGKVSHPYAPIQLTFTDELGILVPIPMNMRRKWPKDKFQNMPPKAVYSYKQLPELIYVPFHWSTTDKSDWLAMNHQSESLIVKQLETAGYRV